MAIQGVCDVPEIATASGVKPGGPSWMITRGCNRWLWRSILSVGKEIVLLLDGLALFDVLPCGSYYPKLRSTDKMGTKI